MHAERTAKSASSSGTKLAKTVGTTLLFFFIVGDTLGAGIYTLLGTMANDVGGALWMPLLIALVVALLTAGTYAELITKYPHAGGAARFAERAFNRPFLTFIIGFLMLSSGITTSAALANAFVGDYLTALIPALADFPLWIIAVVFLLLLVGINLHGVRESLTANVIATVIELTGLLLVIVVAAIVFGRGDGDVSNLTEFAVNVTPLEGAFAASIIAFFSFLGFEAAANMAEEVIDPTKSYPRALFGALITAGVVYLLIAIGTAIVVDPEDIATSSGPLLEVIVQSGLPIPAWLFSLIALIAIANGALLFMVMASRAMYGLAEAGLLPTIFGSVRPFRRTPWFSILIVGGATMLLTAYGDVGTLADTTVLLLLLVFISANISVLVLKKDKVAHKHFSVPRIVSILALIASVVLLTQQEPIAWAISGGYIVIGTILFLVAWYTRKKEDRGNSNLAERQAQLAESDD